MAKLKNLTLPTFVLLLGLYNPVCAASTSNTTEKLHPNIVVIISDDHRYDCIGAAGNPHVKTPHIDELAKSGIYYPQATAHVSQCSPNRAVILTGTPPYRTGWLSNQTQWKEVHNRDGFHNIATVPGVLKDGGYQTILVGKWHLTPDPWNCGFTHVRKWIPQGAGAYRNLAMANGNSRNTTSTAGFTQDILGDDASQFIRSEDSRRQPFFLWLALTAPHTPLHPNPLSVEKLYSDKSNSELAPPGFTYGAPSEKFTSFTVRGGRKKTPAAPAKGVSKNKETNWRDYYSAITSVDEQVGKVKAALKDAHLDQETIIVFLGDNGMMCGSRGWSGKVLPYDESIRIPMIVYAPGIAKTQGRSESLVSSLDLSPSFLKWAGAKVPPEWPGRDLTATLLEPSAKGFDFSITMFADNVSRKFGKMEYRSVRTADAKLIEWHDAEKGTEFFDLKSDPRELKNQFGNPSYSPQISQLKGLLKSWQKQHKDPGSARSTDVVTGEGED